MTKRLKPEELTVLCGLGPDPRKAKDSREERVLRRLADKGLVTKLGGRRERNPQFVRTDAGAQLADHESLRV
jgi:hypothetical protein